MHVLNRLEVNVAPGLNRRGVLRVNVQMATDRDAFVLIQCIENRAADIVRYESLVELLHISGRRASRLQFRIGIGRIQICFGSRSDRFQRPE